MDAELWMNSDHHASRRTGAPDRDARHEAAQSHVAQILDTCTPAISHRDAGSGQYMLLSKLNAGNQLATWPCKT
jgi:hypothetical protein